MSQRQERPPNPSAFQLAKVIRALQLGDVLCAVPAWRALRKALPQAHVTLMGLLWSRKFVDRFGIDLDAFLEFPLLPWDSRGPVEFLEA